MGRFTFERPGTSNAAKSPVLSTAKLLRNMGHLGTGSKKPKNKNKGPPLPATLILNVLPTTCNRTYSVDSISKPQASSRGSGMYFEFLLRRAHSRRRVDRRY